MLFRMPQPWRFCGRGLFTIENLRWTIRGTDAPISMGAGFTRGMASKKAGGSSGNGRDSWSKSMGVKKFGSEWVIPGNIIVRQHGARWHPGEFVGMGRDFTLFSLASGQVRFESRDGQKRRVSVVPAAQPLKARRVNPLTGFSFGELFRLRSESSKESVKSRFDHNPYSGDRKMFLSRLRWRKVAPKLY